MAKIHLMGAALVAAAVVAGCCDKENCTESNTAKPEAAAPAAAAKPAAEVAPEPPKDPNEVVMKIGEAKLTRGQVDADVEKVLAFYGDKIPAEQKAMAKQQIAMDAVRNFMQEEILCGKAKALGYVLTDEDLKKHEAELAENAKNRPDAPATFAELAAKHPLGAERAMAEVKSSLLIEKMLVGEVLSKDTKDYAEEAAKIIERVKKDNASCLSDADALKKIKELKAELDKTPDAEKAAKFAALAKEHSGCPSGQKGGDLGEFQHGMMVPEFDEVSFAQDVGQISDPVKTKFGYHLILTTGKSPATEAKGDEPAKPESVQASHILIKVSEPQELPKAESLVDMLKKSANRQKIREFVMEVVQSATVEAAPEYALLVPPKPAEKTETAVEKPTEK